MFSSSLKPWVPSFFFFFLILITTDILMEFLNSGTSIETWSKSTLRHASKLPHVSPMGASQCCTFMLFQPGVRKKNQTTTQKCKINGSSREGQAASLQLLMSSLCPNICHFFLYKISIHRTRAFMSTRTIPNIATPYQVQPHPTDLHSEHSTKIIFLPCLPMSLHLCTGHSG